MKQLRKRYLKEEEVLYRREEEEVINIRKDRFQMLTETFQQIGRIG